MLSMTPNDIKSESSSSTPALEAGVYPAVISLIADLGVQRDVKFDSRKVPEDKRTASDYEEKHQLWFSFSFPTERYEVELEDGSTVERDVIKGKQMTLSKNSKSNLQKAYVALCKKGETYAEMLGMPCTVSYGPNSNGTLSILSIAGPMRGTDVADPIKPLLLVDEKDYDDLEELDLPPFIKEMIQNRVQ